MKLRNTNINDLYIHAVLDLRRQVRVKQTRGLERLLAAYRAWKVGDEDMCYFSLLQAMAIADDMHDLLDRLEPVRRHLRPALLDHPGVDVNTFILLTGNDE